MYTNKIRRSIGKISATEKIFFKEAQYPASSKGTEQVMEDPSMQNHPNPIENTDEATPTETYTADDAKRIGDDLGVDWGSKEWSPLDVVEGMDIEKEHVEGEFATIKTDEEVFQTAATHLDENKEYYRLLKKYVEKSAQLLNSVDDGGELLPSKKDLYDVRAPGGVKRIEKKLKHFGIR